MNTQLSLRRIAAMLLVSLGLATGAVAHAGQGGKTDAVRGHNMYQRGHHMKGFKRLHDELKLNEQQETLWKEAREAQKAEWKTLHERAAKHRAELKESLKPGADLRAVLKRIDDFHAEMRDLQKQGRERLLKIYDSLDGEQKEKVRAFFQERLDRDGVHHGRRGHRKMKSKKD